MIKLLVLDYTDTDSDPEYSIQTLILDPQLRWF